MNTTADALFSGICSLIEENDFTAKRLRLVDNRGTELGEFEIQDIQYLESVGATQITV